MNNLPEAVYLYLMEFLPYVDRVEATSCQTFWYWELMTYVKNIKLELEPETINTWQVEKYRRLLLQQIHNPRKQLECDLYAIPDSNYDNFPFKEVFRLRGDVDTIRSILRIADFQVSELEILSGETDELISLLEMAQNKQIEKMTLNDMTKVIELPAHPHVRFLQLQTCCCSLPPAYCNQLQTLFLCPSLTDVSMFGQIPDLSISYCDSLRDVSPLQNNRKLKLEMNNSIESFSNIDAEDLEIYIDGRDDTKRINLSKLRRVTRLTLNSLNPKALKFDHCTLPTTTKRLFLFEQFSDYLDWKSQVRYLREIKLKGCKGISNLTGLGLEMVPVIELNGWPDLVSLEGLKYCNGIEIPNKNQVVRLIACSKVSDFSPLSGIPSVTICSCPLFDASHITGTKCLTIEGKFNEMKNLSTLAETNPVVILRIKGKGGNYEDLQDIEDLEIQVLDSYGPKDSITDSLLSYLQNGAISSSKINTSNSPLLYR